MRLLWHPRRVSAYRDPREFVQEQRDYEPGDLERFDRIEFALAVLRILNPQGMTVAVYRREHRLSIDRGRDLARPYGSTWAIVGIPSDASRRHIALTLAELAGLGDVPYLVDALTQRAMQFS